MILLWKELLGHLKERGESTLNQIYIFGKKNKLCLEDSIIKIIENGNLSLKSKLSKN